MRKYKVTYNYTTYTQSIHGQRVKGYDIFEADSSQDAIDQCRQEFYIENELEILSVEIWSLAGYWYPLDTKWI